MSKSTPTHSTSKSAPVSGASGDSGHQQDWWSRLSRTQSDSLRPLTSQLFEKVDDALFDRSGSSSQQFFEGMRTLRKSRDALTQGWFDRLDEGWSALRPLAPGAFRPRLVSARGRMIHGVDDPDFAGLSLVDEETLERNLAVENMVARGTSLCRLQLPPLLHRLTLLRKGVEVEVAEVPAAPQLLVQTFAQALDEIPDLPVEVALVAFKLFDRVVMGAVGAVCQELNRLLVLGGIAPQWNWSPPTRPVSEPQAPRQNASAPAPAAESAEDRTWLETVQAVDPAGRKGADSVDPAMTGFFDGQGSGFGPGGFAEDMDQTRLTASVRALLEHRRLARYAALHGPVAGQPSYAGGGVAQAAPRALELETLIEVLASLPPPELPSSWVGDTEEENWDTDLLKDELRRSLGQRIRNSVATQRGMHPEAAGQRRVETQDVALGEHEDVIDMVAMMFNFIQKDEALPSAVQALLSRLQLPYLRLALVDTALFADAEHPARVLMDRLAEVGKACTPGSPMLAERMLKMHSLVGRIVNNHDVKRSFFEAEWQRFRSWSDALAQRAAAREQELATALSDAEAHAPASTGEAETPDPELAQFLASAQQAAIGIFESSNSAQPASTDANGVDADAPIERAHSHQIRLAVTAKMRERIEDKLMPDGLRHALSLLWVNHQTRIWQEHGERSYEASSLERQLDAIVTLLDVQAGARAQADLDRDWPGIERAWSAVLAEGPAPADARARWIDTFRRWADIRTGRAADDPSIQWNWYEGMTSPRIAMTFIVSGGTDQAAGNDASAQQTAESRSRDGTAKGVPAFRPRVVPGNSTPARWSVGDWIEFKKEAVTGDASPRNKRGKVSWIGSFTGRTVLVKTDGTLWREEERADLDDLLDRGLASIVPRASLFDRSLRSMFDRLREGAASALAPAAPA